MTFLSTESFHTLARGITAEDLHELRATDTRLKDVADSFRRVEVTNTTDSVDGFRKLLNADHLRVLVESLDIKEGARLADADEVRWIPPEPVASTEEDEKLYRLIQAVLAEMHRLPHLSTVRLIFHEAYDVPLVMNFDGDPPTDVKEPPPSASIDLQRAVFLGLASAGENSGELAIRTLEVQNLLPYTHASFAHKGLASLLSSLYALKITINDASLEVGAYQAENLYPFYKESLPHILCASRELRSLTLAPRAITIGNDFSLDFNKLSFPHLEELSLARISFNEGLPDGPERFIVRHANSLRSLELVHCSIEKHESELEIGYPWAMVWKHFAEELKSLTKLRVEWQGMSGAQNQFGYCSLDSGVGYGPSNFISIEGTEGDSAALDAFAAIIKAIDGGEVTILDTIPNDESDEDDASKEEGEEGV